MQSVKLLTNINRILFLMYKHGSIFIIKKKKQEIKTIIIASAAPNLVFTKTPRTLFELLYVHGYIKLRQIIRSKFPNQNEETREYYTLSTKGENCMKFKYPKG